jgi:hypothetical protein
MSEGVIVPIEQRTIDFYGDELVAAQDEAGTVWVPVKQLSDSLGLAWAGQYERIKRDAVLSTEARFIRVTRINPTGGRPDVVALPLKYVRAWLFGVNANRVKAELRDRLIAYQREVIELIDRAFTPPVGGLDTTENHMIAMRDLARHQAELWDQMLHEKRRLDSVQALAEDHEGLIRDLERRIDEVSRELSREVNRCLAAMSAQLRLLPAPSEETLSVAQKAAIKALVDDLVAAAQRQGVRLGQGRNDYPAVWDAFKRRFDLAKYDELPSAQFDEALGWLKAWKDRIG